MDKLKRCPFCGGKATLKQSKEYPEVWTCGCKKCDVIFYKKGSKAALKAWNKRYERTCNINSEIIYAYYGEPIDEVYKCSECSEPVCLQDNYCPNCGARVIHE